MNRKALFLLVAAVAIAGLALSNAAGQLASGGEIHIVDFGQLDRWPPVVRKLFWAWLAQFHVSPRPELIMQAKLIAQEHNLTTDIRSIAGGYAWLLVLRSPTDASGNSRASGPD